MLRLKRVVSEMASQDAWSTWGRSTARKWRQNWRVLLPPAIARVAIAIYLLNHGWTHLVDHWWRFSAIKFPLTALPMLAVGSMLLFNWQAHIVALCLVCFQAYEVAEILGYRLYMWIVLGSDLYLNELMVKKIAMLGVAIMFLLQEPQFKTSIDRARNALGGLIDERAASSVSTGVVEEDDGGGASSSSSSSSSAVSMSTHKISHKTSALLLVVRLFIASLFVFVGFGEILRQLAGGIVRNGVLYKRPPGDGHDQLWLKVVQVFLSLPFIVGFQTMHCALGLAAAMSLESLIYWRWWETSLGIPYFLHARDHFITNFAVAGGLLLLLRFGPGRYSIDELVKKKSK